MEKLKFILRDADNHLAELLKNDFELGLIKPLSMKSLMIEVQWWNTFLEAISVDKEPLLHNQDFTLSRGNLVFNFHKCYDRISYQWWNRYRESIPCKVNIIKMLRRSEYFISKDKGLWEVDAFQLVIADDLIHLIKTI